MAMVEPSNLLVVIEDHEDTSKIIEKVLTRKGYRVKLYSFWDSTVCFDFVLENKAALVITDIFLDHDLSGLDIIEQLRGDERTKHIPILALTAASVAQLKPLANLLDNKSYRLMYKPFQIANLLQNVKELLDNSQLNTF